MDDLVHASFKNQGINNFSENSFQLLKTETSSLRGGSYEEAPVLVGCRQIYLGIKIFS